MSPPRGRCGLGDEHAAVALESVLVLPLVLLLLVAVLGTTVVVSDELAVTRAARAGAREVALTGDRERAAVVVRAVVPTATVAAEVDRGVAVVEVTRHGAVLGVGYAVTARAAAPLEPVAR